VNQFLNNGQQTMKPTSKLTIFALTLLVLTASANAQSPPEELLKQMVGQLQTTPNDNALREKIIKLGAEIKPAPAIPEEAERRMARGAAAFKSATAVADFQDAAKEYEQATVAAPWYGDAYNNLGVVQDKAGNYEAALRSLKLALLASPGSKEIKALIYEVEYRSETATKQAAIAAAKKAEEEKAAAAKAAAKPAGLDFSGNWVTPGGVQWVIEKNGDGWIVSDATSTPFSVVKTQGRQLWLEQQLTDWSIHYELVLSEDGRTIEVAFKNSSTTEQLNRMKKKGFTPDPPKWTRFTMKRK
jgi:tetratricopeptide (TPR) repeat protein